MLGLYKKKCEVLDGVLGVGGCRFVWCCLAVSIDIRFGFHVDPSSQHDVPACSLRDSCPIQTDPTGSPCCERQNIILSLPSGEFPHKRQSVRLLMWLWLHEIPAVRCAGCRISSSTTQTTLGRSPTSNYNSCSTSSSPSSPPRQSAPSRTMGRNQSMTRSRSHSVHHQRYIVSSTAITLDNIYISYCEVMSGLMQNPV